MKRVRKICVLLLFLVFFKNNFCGYRNLIVLLDWNYETVAADLSPEREKGPHSGFSPVTSMLVTALWQKAAPVIVTSSIWKNFVERKKIFGDFTSKSDTDLIEQYTNTYSRFNDEASIKNFAQLCKDIYTKQLSPEDFKLISGFLLPYITLVEEQEWKIQKINDFFYLLIPTRYLTDIEQYKDTPKNPGNVGLSDENLLLGLKTVTPLANPFVIDAHKTPPTINYSQEFIKTLPNIFVTVKDLAASKTEENIGALLHDWIFFVNGHGSPEPAKEEIEKKIKTAQEQYKFAKVTITFTTHIAGLETKDFQKFLAFLNKNIKTDFLFYETCYAGGLHLVKPYELAWFDLPQQPGKSVRQARTENIFNYTIATGTLAHVVTISYTPTIQTPFPMGSKPTRFGQNFTEFFSKTALYLTPPPGTKPTPLTQVLQTVHHFIDDKGTLSNVMQIPAVRFPNTEWFSVIDTPKKVAELSQVLVKVHEAEKKPIIIKDKQVVLLYTETPSTESKEAKPEPHMAITVPIQIQQTEKLVFISRVPDEALYNFKRLEAKQWGLHDLLVNFLFVNEVGAGRKYYIETLLCKNDLPEEQTKLIAAGANEALTLKNVLIVNNALDKEKTKRNYGIFFQFNDTNFSAFWPSTDTQALQMLNTTKTIPNLKQEASTVTIPRYPFPIEKEGLEKVVEVQKKRAALAELKLSPAETEAIKKQFEDLAQAFEDFFYNQTDQAFERFLKLREQIDTIELSTLTQEQRDKRNELKIILWNIVDENKKGKLGYYLTNLDKTIKDNVIKSFEKETQQLEGTKDSESKSKALNKLIQGYKFLAVLDKKIQTYLVDALIDQIEMFITEKNREKAQELYAIADNLYKTWKKYNKDLEAFVPKLKSLQEKINALPRPTQAAKPTPERPSKPAPKDLPKPPKGRPLPPKPERPLPPIPEKLPEEPPLPPIPQPKLSPEPVKAPAVSTLKDYLEALRVHLQTLAEKLKS